jgi:hypothetical protein
MVVVGDAIAIALRRAVFLQNRISQRAGPLGRAMEFVEDRFRAQSNKRRTPVDQGFFFVTGARFEPATFGL